MIEPLKIRVLYFDGSGDTLERFAAVCGCQDMLNVLGSFRSFPEIAPALERDGYRFAALLAPDVVVVRMHRAVPGVGALLQDMKRFCRVKLVGLLGTECVRDPSLVDVLDYYTEETAADGVTTDEDVYRRLFYQIKTAKLSQDTQQAGLKGKWAVLPLPSKPAPHRKFHVIVMGASAGGTQALTTILSALGADLPPILAVQHMPDSFPEFFAKNLAAKTAAKIVIARDGEVLEDGVVYFAGSGRHLEVVKDPCGVYRARCAIGEKVSGHRPSVDVLFRSAAKAAGDAALGVILTGMGSDGAQGLLEMREAGAYTIGQDKESCAVYGMPMAAYHLGAVAKQLPLDSIAKAIQLAVAQSQREETGK